MMDLSSTTHSYTLPQPRAKQPASRICARSAATNPARAAALDCAASSFSALGESSAQPWYIYIDCGDCGYIYIGKSWLHVLKDGALNILSRRGALSAPVALSSSATNTQSADPSCRVALCWSALVAFGARKEHVPPLAGHC
jgi:hypothetical protein